MSDRRPLLLDLFCGAGGAAVGYARAGFDVVGVDNVPQPRYPFPFIQADALEYCAAHGSEYDVIHASPPCQRYSSMGRATGTNGNHPDYIAITRTLLRESGRLWVIENVVGAPLSCPITLCGAMFGLRVYRHRLFEASVMLLQPPRPRHILRAAHAGKIPVPGEFWSPAGCFGQKDDAQRAMGIDWMETTGARSIEIAQSIPPAYTEFVGKQLLSALTAWRAKVGGVDVVTAPVLTAETPRG